MPLSVTLESTLPRDGGAATLVGRAWVPGAIPGPGIVVVRDGGLYDISRCYATMAALLDAPDPAAAAHQAAADAPLLSSLADCLANSPAGARDPSCPYLLAPPDLQAIKACGVTFVFSMLERVIEEQAKGDRKSTRLNSSH